MIFVTNNLRRPLLALADIPAKHRQDFDYIEDANELRLVKYKGVYFDLLDMQITPYNPRSIDPIPFDPWDVYQHATYSSGWLFQVFSDNTAICGMYYA